MRSIDRKALRDLWKIKGQALAIGLVIGAGVAMYIMMFSTFDSLRLTQEAYYDRYRFADVFAAAKRVPQRLEERIVQIPGVQSVATRVVAQVTLDVEGMTEPVVGRLISVPARRNGGILNDLALLAGRWIEPGRLDEALVNQGFAEAHELQPGHAVTAVINGRRRDLEIVGIALSPEYVYTVRPGEWLPDDKRFGLLWMNRKALATAFDMEGGFNDVALTLLPGASEPEVIAHLDRLLQPYGGLGAIPRSQQISHWWLDDQLSQLQASGKVIPLIFLGVGALLLTIVLNRIVTVQRGQIGDLKALGYTNREIARHYMIWGLAIALAGTLIGLASGAWLGRALTVWHAVFFDFPFLIFRISPQVVLGAGGISFAAAFLGTASAVRRAVRLPPAEAMRPEPPGHYRQTWVERLGLSTLLTEPARMILRNLQRRPFRAFASVVGIGFAGALLIVGWFSLDGMDEMMDVQFNVAQRQDMTVSFVEPQSAGALHEIKGLPGGLHAEAMRSVPVRFRYGHRFRQAAVTGLATDARLNRVINSSVQPVTLPAEGLVLSTKLAEVLGADRGDTVTLEVLEGGRPVRQARVTDLVDEYIGMSAYMEIEALHRLLREGPSLSGAYLQIDEARSDELYRRLKSTPAVAGAVLKSATLDSFNSTIKETMWISAFFNILFAGIIAVGVVYNAARVSLSERSHELASLRVLGFTRAEISFILLGELAVLTLAAVPLGLLLGYGLAALTVTAYETEMYRVPLVVSPRVMAYSAITVLTASALSGFAVRRRLDKLDLVAVLKTRE
jgi:putative ABC transport system permease protein